MHHKIFNLLDELKSDISHLTTTAERARSLRDLLWYRLENIKINPDEEIAESSVMMGINKSNIELSRHIDLSIRYINQYVNNSSVPKLNATDPADKDIVYDLTFKLTEVIGLG
jgi:hypothetical protein